MGANGRKPIFFTSDWHLGHTNCLDFDNRPYDNLSQMHRSLIKKYNAVVPVDGICYFLGDMGISATIIKDVVSKLNGTKVLIQGNHDRGDTAMYNMGFDVVLNEATIYIGKERVTMTHCPLRGILREDVTAMKCYTPVEGVVPENWHGENKQNKFSIEDQGQFHAHGHIHSPNGGKSQRILDRQMDVGVVANKYMPVSLSQIESWIIKTKQKEQHVDKA